MWQNPTAYLKSIVNFLKNEKIQIHFNLNFMDHRKIVVKLKISELSCCFDNEVPGLGWNF